MARAFRYMLIPVFATTVFAYCLFVIISFVGQKTALSYNVFVVLICAIAAAFINYRFALRERSLTSIFVLNAIMLVATEFFGFTAPNDVSGFWPRTIAGACFAAPVIHGLLLSREPMKLNTMLLYCEFSIAGTIVFIGLQVGDLTVAPFANGLSITALILNLFMLSILRISGPAKKAEGGWKSVQRGALLSASLVGVVFAAAAVALFLLPASRNAIFTAADAMRGAFIFVGEGIGRFIEFLLSLIPAGGPQTDIVPGVTMVGVAARPDVKDAQAIDPRLALAILIICAIAAAVALIFLLIRFRSKKVRARVANVRVYEEEIGESRPLLRALLSLLAGFVEWLRFLRYCSLRRDTYEGAFLRISHSAKRHGLRRKASETPRAFLYRIAKHCGESRAAALLDAISDAVDRRLYSLQPAGFVHITGSEAESLSLLLKAIGGRRPADGSGAKRKSESERGNEKKAEKNHER